MIKRLLYAAIVMSLLVMLALVVTLAYVIRKPETLEPASYHPLNIMLKMKGYPVNPWVPVDSERHHILKMVDVNWPVLWQGRYRYDEFLDFAVNEFTRVYTNVNVERIMVSLGTLEKSMYEALQSGEMPDLYCGPFLPELANSGWVVPLTPFVSKEECSLVEPGALEAVTLQGDLWAWPRWIEPAFMAANRGLLIKSGIEVEAIQESGWTWQEFVKILKEMKNKSGVKPLALNTTSPDLLRLLFMASGVNSMYDSGSGALGAAQLRPVLGFIEELYASGILPSDKRGKPQNMYDSFWSGNCAVIGPVRSGFLRHLEDRQKLFAAKEVGPIIDVVLLPIPHRDGSSQHTPVEVNAITVFSHPNDRDVSKLRLAVELGRFLTRGEASWLAAELHTVPAYVPDQEGWSVSPEIMKSGGGYMIESLRNAIPQKNLGHGMDSIEKRFWTQAAPPPFQEFLCGKMSPDSAAQAIASKARSLIGISEPKQ